MSNLPNSLFSLHNVFMDKPPCVIFVPSPLEKEMVVCNYHCVGCRYEWLPAPMMVEDFKRANQSAEKKINKEFALFRKIESAKKS